MKTLFITALFNIHIHGSLGRGMRLEDELFLTNDQSQIKSLLTSHFEHSAGKLETDCLRDNGTAIYSISNFPNPTLTKGQALLLLNQQLGRVVLFLTALWLVKDNSVNNELGFLECPYKPPRDSKIFLTSNSRRGRFAKADGSIQATDFTDSEMRVARDLYSQLFSANVINYDEYRGYVVPEDYHRLSRIFYFVQAARETSDLGNRISRYVTCFEALFCTDAAEMAHKLSERVAFFSTNTPTERSTIFRDIKTAYNIRSKTVHGDKISKKLAEQAQSIAVTCDKLLRDILIKILTTPNLLKVFIAPSNELEEYLTGLVLGNHNI